MKNLRISVNGISYDVEVGDMTECPVKVIVNGKNYDVLLEDQAVTSVTATPKPVVTKPIAPAPKPVTSVPTGARLLRAPMPGTILDIAVKAGDKVTRGQLICALEAMKMKNAIKSPVDGVIAAVNVECGQKVAYNDLIVSFE
jgi:glutaconyl-CoA/methylmalonyl-CoA decarboxylase subunit gamma